MEHGGRQAYALCSIGLSLTLVLFGCSSDDDAQSRNPINGDSAGGTALPAGSGAQNDAAGGTAGGTVVTTAGSGGAASGGSGVAGGPSAGSGSNADAGGGDVTSTDAGTMMSVDAGSIEEEPPACDKHVDSSTNCSDPLAPGDRRSCTVGTRSYELYAGKSWNLCEPTALVIDAHGATETAQQQAGEDEFCATGGTCWHGLGSGWKAEADQPGAGFIVVFPQGINNMWGTGDADFMLQIVDEIKKVADIDPAKVYITGISNGGALTYWTGCPHSDVFHGMSPNAGGANCTSVKQPVPVIAFDDEPDFAYQGSVDAANTMVQLNHCTGGPKPWATIDAMYDEAVCRSAKEDVNATLVPCSEVGSPIEPTTCQVWDQCDDDVQVVFCKVAANTEHGAANAALDGHIIYENNTILNTPSLAWRFFKQFWK